MSINDAILELMELNIESFILELNIDEFVPDVSEYSEENIDLVGDAGEALGEIIEVLGEGVEDDLRGFVSLGVGGTTPTDCDLLGDGQCGYQVLSGEYLFGE